MKIDKNSECTYVYNVMTMAFKAAGGTTSSKAGNRMSLRRKSGSALLIVLAFVAIMAVVLLAFLANSRRALQQSQSSATIVKTQMLGELATAAVIDDLLDEMKAGADEEPAAGEPIKVTSPSAMLPHRVLKVATMANDANFANLVKQSVSGQAFFPNSSPYLRGGALRASSSNTSAPAKNQRRISGERWNKPRLLGTATGLGSFTSEQLPDWIYITRDGVLKSASDLDAAKVANKAPSNNGYVLGRFAYNIYQVDGLLDVNVSGFSTANASSAAQKGSAAWADLKAIPGLDASGVANQLVEWRNKQTISDYPRMVAGLAPGSSSDTLGPWGEPGGFLKPYSDGSVSDNRFFGRQDLLRYLASQHDASLGVEKAAPFLTTFSADLDQPSFRPDPNRPKVASAEDQGGNDAFNDESKSPSAQINPPFLDVQSNDEPVTKRRFPLERLKLISSAASSGDAALIEKYFGLRRNGSQWDYVAGDSDGAIRRLSDLEGDEPNMIELLKAAIATGSLGGQLNHNEDRAAILEARDSSIDYHVMRIAANIIDQYDDDNYPTQIQFQGYTIAGVEDLPYLYGFRVAAYRLQRLSPPSAYVTTAGLQAYQTAAGSAMPDDLYSNVVMMQPIIWNPHAAVASGGRPAKFRIVASTIPRGGTTALNSIYVGARMRWWTSSSAWGNDLPMSAPDPRYLEPRAFLPSEDMITFDVSADLSSPASFREPYVLKSPGYPTGSDARLMDSEDPGNTNSFDTTLAADEQNDVSAGEGSTQAIGFRAGYCWSGPWKSSTDYLQQGKIVSDSGVTFLLQCQTPDGWVTYDTYEQFTMEAEHFALGRASHGAAYINPRYMRYYLRTDPRTDRFGTRYQYMVPKFESDIKGLPQGQSLRRDEKRGIQVASGTWPTNAASKYRFNIADYYLGQLSENKSTDNSVMYYADPDNISRLAMGGYSNGTIVGLPMARGNFDSRPVILNRPFKSVAELGNVMRDQPWKQLDFFSPESGDAALLDVFCLYESENPEADPIVAGRVNLNTKRPEVLEAMLRGVNTRETGTVSSIPLGDGDARQLAAKLVEWTGSSDIARGPLRNRSELVGKFVSGTDFSGFSEAMNDVLTNENRAIVSRRQNALRGLVDGGTTRTWTFLIDLIVQDGQFVLANSNDNNFVVRGEKRYWIHVSMDRFTGKVISKRVEEVHE